MRTTISLVGAGAGSFPGASRLHPRLLEEAAQRLREQEGGLLIDSFVARCGDGLELVLTHDRGVRDEDVHDLVTDVLRSCRQLAAGLKLHGAEQGPGGGAVAFAAEMEFEERASEPVLLFMAAGAGPGVWNAHLFRAFADPFTTPGLATDPSLRDGFVFEVHDPAGRRRAFFRTPEESYALLACIGAPSRVAVARALSREGSVAASASVPPPESDHAVMIVRAESGFPAVGECLAPFATPILVAGGMRAGRRAPLVPVAVCDANRTIADGPPRATCLGFQLCHGRLVGPADMFDDPAFDPARSRSLELAEVLRNQGPFELRAAEPAATPDNVRWEPLA